MSKVTFKHFDTRKDGTHVTMAITKFAGKTVKAFAKCQPTDTYSEEVGEKIAAARLAVLIAERQYVLDAHRVDEAKRNVTEANRRLNNAMNHLNDAVENEMRARADLFDLLETV